MKFNFKVSRFFLALGIMFLGSPNCQASYLENAKKFATEKVSDAKQKYHDSINWIKKNKVQTATAAVISCLALIYIIKLKKDYLNAFKIYKEKLDISLPAGLKDLEQTMRLKLSGEFCWSLQEFLRINSDQKESSLFKELEKLITSFKEQQKIK